MPYDNFVLCLQAARTGAEWAWTAIYRDLAPTLLGYFRSHRAPEPDDLTGEVFADVVRSLDTFEGGERDFRAWVFTIAHNRLVDDLRRRSRRPVEPGSQDFLEWAGPRGNVETDALRAIALDEVRRVIDGLTSDQRQVILLRILGGLTVEEVAGAIGKSPVAVKALQRRGLAAINREISLEAVSL
jgi:RNA polymerase sigma factor (sigma-70 family)